MITSYLSLFLIWPLRAFAALLILIAISTQSVGPVILAVIVLVVAGYIGYAANHTVRVRK